MTATIGLVTVKDEASVDATERLLGAPLVLWAVNNFRRVLPLDHVFIVSDDPAIQAIAATHGIAMLDPGASIDTEHILVHDAMRPFCTEATIRDAMARNARELEASRFRSIERITIRNKDDLELARAVATGLPPGHPCVTGIRRMRLPLAAEIDTVVTDVDGVLTNGCIHVHSGGEQARAFHMQDGLGSRILQEAGFAIGWLSAAKDDGSTRARAERLQIQHVDVGDGDKGERFTRLCADMGADPKRTLYLGDDVNDLPAMRLARLAVCPANARPEVKAAADCILDVAGGDGAFRELADMLIDDLRLRAALSEATESSEKEST